MKRGIPLVLLGLIGLLFWSSGIVAESVGQAVNSENWHTFLGSQPESPGDSDDDQGYGIAVDGAGSAYLVGQSIPGDWDGSLVITHSLGLDGFLVKLDGDGTQVWHTFIGGTETDVAQAVTLDDADNLFVVGTSNGGIWNTEPISPHHGSRDVFVARFNTEGARQWFTFLGTPGEDFGHAIALDGSGNIYVSGTCVVNPYLAKLNSAGEFQWQRVITSTAGDLGPAQAVAVDQNGDVYVAGYGIGEWYGVPPPVRPCSGQEDAFVAKFDGGNGTLLWHTFLGSEWNEAGYALAVDTNQAPSAVYVAGESGASWGNPLAAFNGATDAFVARLNSDQGTLVWNTFLGSVNYADTIQALTFDRQGNLHLVGQSREGWGRPVIPHPGGGVGDAAFAAALSPEGYFLGNTFIGGAASSDQGYGIAVSQQDTIYACGTSWSPDSVGWSNPSWGTPIRAFSGTRDAFVARLGTSSVVRYWIYAPIVLK